jgi:nitroreductase
MPIREAVLDLWSAAIDEFPLGGTAADQLAAVVPFAILAPSSHNSQPWQFRLSRDSLELWADRSRSLPVMDPDDRELTISCGAALGCLEVALHNFGFAGDIDLLPDPAMPDLLARVGLGEQRDPTDLEHARFSALRVRRTHRLPFQPRTLDQSQQDAFRSLAESMGTWFDVLASESSRFTLAELITLGDRDQMSAPEFRKELSAWLRPNGSGERDGMPGWAFGLGMPASHAFPLIIRTFDVGTGRAARDRELALQSPVLAVLGTATDSVRDWIQTGRALSLILLHAASEGIAASFLNQPIERAELRHKVVALLGHSGFPQLILRMGYPEGRARRTPRRAIGEVLERR